MWCELLFVCLLQYETRALQLFTQAVEVSEGKLRGVRGIGRHYFSVPYATAGRFQLPQPPPKWNGTFYATNRFIRCPQYLNFVVGREDCLYLDIHAPDTTDTILPVMVFIHGGAYWHGGKDPYHPLVLNSKNIVVVTVNYRLGVLGFICLNNISNLGLRDQVAALKWIRKNIKAFGGDPDNITICGQSAGGSLASMHLLSKASKGLFHKAILMSGTVLSPWAFNLESLQTSLIDANKIARSDTEKDAYEIFKNLSLETLMKATSGSSIEPRYFRYTPCIDSKNTDPFFSDTPYHTIASGEFNKVPLMVGYTELEGMFFYGLLDRNYVKELNDNFHNHLPSIFSWCSKRDKLKIANTIRANYFGNATIDLKKDAQNLIQFYSDWIAYGTTNAFTKLMRQKSNEPIYNYVFTYLGARNFGNQLSGVEVNSSTHSDDVFYIFKPAGIELKLSQRDKLFVNKMNTVIANFIKYGNPTPTASKSLPPWRPATLTTPYYMKLDDTFLQETFAEEHQGDFFLNVLCTYGREGYVPCRSAQMCKPNKDLL